MFKHYCNYFLKINLKVILMPYFISHRNHVQIILYDIVMFTRFNRWCTMLFILPWVDFKRRIQDHFFRHTMFHYTTYRTIIQHSHKIFSPLLTYTVFLKLYSIFCSSEWGTTIQGGSCYIIISLSKGISRTHIS